MGANGGLLTVSVAVDRLGVGSPDSKSDTVFLMRWRSTPHAVSEANESLEEPDAVTIFDRAAVDKHLRFGTGISEIIGRRTSRQVLTCR